MSAATGSGLVPSVFERNGKSLRVQTVDGEHWFAAKDICDALGLTNPSDAIKSLEDDERSKLNLGRQGQTWFVNESGLYAIVLQSRKAEARAFRKWVTSEVLPSIARTGGYATAGRVVRGTEGPHVVGRIVAEVGQHTVRGLNHDGRDWWHLRELSDLLGYEQSNFKFWKRQTAADNVLEMGRELYVNAEGLRDIFTYPRRHWGEKRAERLAAFYATALPGEAVPTPPDAGHGPRIGIGAAQSRAKVYRISPERMAEIMAALHAKPFDCDAVTRLLLS